ncbi:MAG: Rap1a/Tai family immunity protein [Gemmobacter sp.]
MKRITIIAAVALLWVGLLSPAEAVSGRELKEQCNSDKNGLLYGICIGYIVGYIHGMDYGVIMTILLTTEDENTYEEAKQINEHLHRICIPNGVQRGQLPLIILKFLDDNPQRLHESSRFLVADALRLAFPCK